MDKQIIFHGRLVEQRTCDLCGRVIYLEESLYQVRKRCRSYMKANGLHAELNKIIIKITNYWKGNLQCKHICQHCMDHNPDHPSIFSTDPNDEIITSIMRCIYTEDDTAIFRFGEGGIHTPPSIRLP